MAKLKPFMDSLPIPDVVKPIGTSSNGHLTIKAKAKKVKLHKNLPATNVWSYRLDKGKVIKNGSGSSFLGPTVQISRGDLVNVFWQNKIDPSETLPYEVVKVPYIDGSTPVPPENVPGQDATTLTEAQDFLRAKAHNLQAALVTHLHGGRSQADSDGWPDNTSTPNQTAHYVYHNNQKASMLWYHDHANYITRLNVYAGLAGVWLIRDDEENSLGLPDGDFELPLVIQDRNLDLDSTNKFTGALLHKTEVTDGPAEFFGPYTLVNGKIWPKAEVEPRLYRFRLLNGSNARTYRIVLLASDGANHSDKMLQIGGDQGLADNLLTVSTNGLILAPGERADIVFNFDLFNNQKLYLWNTAEAPFGNDPTFIPDAASELAVLLAPGYNHVGNISDTARRPHPQIMRFDVVKPLTGVSQVMPTADTWITPRMPLVFKQTTPIRLMALIEKPPMSANETAMLVFWEYVRSSDVSPPSGADIIDFSYFHPETNLPVTEKFWLAAEEFYDRINWFIHQNNTEHWYIVNLSPDTHPIHIHLVDFKVNQRSNYDVYVNSSPTPLPPDTAAGDRTPIIDGNRDPITGARLMTVNKIVANSPMSPSNDQTVPKDTTRVDPGEIIGVAIKFSPYAGRYMYHCHILEHEDDDMMRPFVVVPEWVPHHGH